jgi:phosphatidylserine/phosphatidylglycerophosphate/cardiolipin synthase-like enzyme
VLIQQSFANHHISSTSAATEQSTMNSFVTKLQFWKQDDASSGDEIFDKDATSLSHVGTAIHDCLRKHHNRHHHKMWNVTRGSIVENVQQTPRHLSKDDPEDSHSDWFPELMGELIAKTEYWCDVTSLGPPDGKFMECFKKGLATLAAKSVDKEKPVIVRMMFGNIAGMPVNCTAVIKALTADLPPDANIHLWVGAWRRGFSWNHSKLIAVDGVHLHTGGHNLWDKHYLACNPVHDLSIQLEGDVARDGHRYANQQWEFVERKQKTCVGCVVDMMPDGLPLVLKTRVTVSEWPEGVANVFPPMFTKEAVGEAVTSRERSQANDVPLISIGRQGAMVYKARPSDDAILAMINSSNKIIRMTLQDIGPVCVPGSKKSLPGLKWPKAYLTAIGKAIYERGVDVEIVLSNPNSIPGGLKGTEANYGNGWDCVDVAAEIIKRIQKSYGTVDDEKLRAMIAENLRICFIRHDKESKYQDGKSIGLHSKHFIVDDTCCYIGSQNLYMVSINCIVLSVIRVIVWFTL